mmetsp:Transcript_11249/g.33729  ORF Transcript_11249/g.33729 Transcript_11249/m.33729 type:complete len:779 (-) Transcript_11249:22-2358(-)|eukprot:CAMPEP_0206316782 /NCGR_PEP_ID=MMETSP0106_2-20121207/16280_1 /ASSEMBLY_ACC=CAM_ASM_000206 /TAXON_ID=81532 /ORGANISM="Acanthoeca-like sp., Strain 10tr" /LENGTH=778 /DNA_ID=CAMNT_0053748319 /DNA_START=26 /DNA_END=2362 /DNA_ORIENTATION=+
MGLCRVSWEVLTTDEATLDASWQPYPFEIARRLEAVYLTHQVVGLRKRPNVIEFTQKLKTFRVEMATWEQVSNADGSICPIRRDVLPENRAPATPPPPGPPNLLSISSSAKIVFSRGTVYIESKVGGGTKNMSAGRLLLVRDGDIFSICWLPAYDRYTASEIARMQLLTQAFNRPVTDFYHFERKDDKLFATLAINGQPTCALPPFSFEAGESAVKAFLAVMQMNLDTAGDSSPQIKRVLDNVNMFVVERPMTSEAVKKAAVKIMADGLQSLQQTLPASEAVKWRIIEGASAVTTFFRRATSTDVVDGDAAAGGVADGDLDDFSSFSLTDVDEVAAGPAEERPVADGGAAESQRPSEPDSNGAVLLGELGTFDIIGKSAQAACPPKVERQECPRGPPVTREVWDRHVNAEFAVEREAELRELIFRGGLHPEIRAEGWKLLLGYRPDRGESLQAFTQRRRREYESMKLQWLSVSEVQYANNSAFRDRIERVAKDVSRTDRETEYFKETGPHIEALGAILCTWCMYNFDQGYVQGMSDIAAVILRVVDDEMTAFWCFIGMMDTVHNAHVNFSTDQVGMKGHLEDLATLVRFTSPRMMERFEETGCENMYFTFRWLLIFLKREFSVPDIIKLWEVMWTGHLTNKYHIFYCLAILEIHRDELDTKDFDQLLQFANGLSGTLDAEMVLRHAESVSRHVLSCTRLPAKIAAFFPSLASTPTAVAQTPAAAAAAATGPDGPVVPAAVPAVVPAANATPPVAAAAPAPQAAVGETDHAVASSGDTS